MTSTETYELLFTLQLALDALMLQPRGGITAWTSEQSMQRVMAKRALRRALDALLSGKLEIAERRQEVDNGSSGPGHT